MEMQISDDVRDAVADELRASYVGYVQNEWSDWVADAFDVIRAVHKAGHLIVSAAEYRALWEHFCWLEAGMDAVALGPQEELRELGVCLD